MGSHLPASQPPAWRTEGRVVSETQREFGVMTTLPVETDQSLEKCPPS